MRASWTCRETFEDKGRERRFYDRPTLQVYDRFNCRMSMTDVNTMTDRLAALRSAMAQACLRAGRDASSVELLPVSKTFSVDDIRQAQALGLTRFGENRMQEVRDKAQIMGETAPHWVIIGHVQTNKARDVARYAAELQTLDRLALAEALDRRLQSDGRTLDALVQVKTAVEPSKHGLAPEDVVAFLQGMAAYPTIRVRGFMTVATQSDEPQVVRACFARLRDIRDQSIAAGLIAHDATRLSMGMSGDFGLAIEEGATEIRIGSALFGARDYPAT